jgi:hypothetical protein
MFPEGQKQVSVLLSAEDYRIISQLVGQERVGHPEYSVGDLLRRYIRRGLKDDAPGVKSAPIDPRLARRRQLHSIVRIARRLAREEQAG